MKKLIAACILSLAALWTVRPSPAVAADAEEAKVAHNVYFSLNDNSDAAKEKFVASCKKYLSGHPDTSFFAVGVLAKDMKRPVNDRDFDVSIHVVFRIPCVLAQPEQFAGRSAGSGAASDR